MLDAIEQAVRCKKDVPIGCVIKKNGNVIAATHNKREASIDVTAHAEILAIQEAQKAMKTSRLKGCEMYVTLEPCPMCAWAIIQSGISTLYYGARNSNYGAIETVLNLPKLANSSIKVYGGIEEKACEQLLEDFFKGIRE